MPVGEAKPVVLAERVDEAELDEAHRELGLGLDVAAESGHLATLYELLQE